MDERHATLVKYRFGALAQMQKHLHVVEGRTLFFLRDPRIPLSGGARVVIEFSFVESEQVTTLRGSVLARIDGEAGHKGIWIEFPDARLARWLEEGASIVPRGQRRVACDMMVQLKARSVTYLGRMIDVSLHGVRIVSAARVEPGDEVEVRIMGAEPPLPALLGHTQVVRADPGGDLALKYVRSDGTARMASGKLFAAVQEAWLRAHQLAHSPLCCGDRQPQEPPLPHMKLRV